MAAEKKGEDEAQADEGEVLWLDAEHACDLRIRILLPHDQGNASAPAPSIVYAPSSLLSSIPYFQNCLSKPWQEERANSRREILLSCADSTSPRDYSKCLLYCVSRVSDWMSVDDVLRLLRAANHLRFEECVDYGMRYLTSLPWSDNEDEIIQQAISDIGIKLSDDMSAKLTAADHMKVFKELLGSLIQMGTKSKGTLFKFVQATFKEAPEQVANLCESMIRDAWFKATDGVISGSTHVVWWIMFTTLLLEHGDTATLLDDFVKFSTELSRVDMRASSYTFSEILIQLLECAVPSKVNKRVVLLSNSKRAELLDAWMPWLANPSSKSVESVLRGLFMSLPLQDPVVVAIVKEHVSNPLVKDWLMWWRSKLFKQMKRCDLVHEEADLEASNSAKRVKLMNVD